jgi:hypothetical protein
MAGEDAKVEHFQTEIDGAIGTRKYGDRPSPITATRDRHHGNSPDLVEQCSCIVGFYYR